MKNLFGAAAPTNRVLKSFKMLMLIVLVAIGFTSCNDQSKSEVSPKTELLEKTDLEKLASNPEIGGNQTGSRRFCHFQKSFDIGGGTGGQERRNFDIGGSSAGQVPPRRICDLCLGYDVKNKSTIGGQGTTKSYSDIGGNQSVPPRRICNVYSKTEIGGGKNSTGGLQIAPDIDGSKGTSTGTGQINSYNQFDIGGKGGKGTSTGGEYYSSDIGGRSTTEEYTISDIGGKSTSTTGNFTLNDIEGKKDLRVIRRKLEPFVSDIGGRGSSGTGL